MEEEGEWYSRPEPIFACIEALGDTPDEVIYLSPDGEPLTQALANTLSLKKHIVLLAGHYKGDRSPCTRSAGDT